MGTKNKKKVSKNVKKSFFKQNVDITNNTTLCRKGIISICNIEKNHFITYYGILPYVEGKDMNNSMCIFTNKKIYAGDPNEKNKLYLGQFANDNAFDVKIISLIKSGDVSDAYQLYSTNSENNNNSRLVPDKKPYLIATRDIFVGEPIYTQYGLSYWILKNIHEFTSDITLLSRINTFALSFRPEINDFVIIYSNDNKFSYEYTVIESINKTTNEKKPVLFYNNDEMSEGMALMILCNLYKFNQIYYSMKDIPYWIYKSPYNALLYLNIVIGVIPQDIDKVIFQHMINKEYSIAYSLFTELENCKLCKDYISKENFIYYYRHWKDLHYIFYKNKI